MTKTGVQILVISYWQKLCGKNIANIFLWKMKLTDTRNKCCELQVAKKLIFLSKFFIKSLELIVPDQGKLQKVYFIVWFWIEASHKIQNSCFVKRKDSLESLECKFINDLVIPKCEILWHITIVQEMFILKSFFAVDKQFSKAVLHWKKKQMPRGSAVFFHLVRNGFWFQKHCK